MSVIPGTHEVDKGKLLFEASLDKKQKPHFKNKPDMGVHATCNPSYMEGESRICLRPAWEKHKMMSEK
jgi:hypothetical protein